MDFKVEGPWDTDKYCRPPWLADQKNFLNSRRSRMPKTVTFWPWWQPFNSFFFESLSFFPLFLFFLFATQKSGGIAGPADKLCNSFLVVFDVHSADVFPVFAASYHFDETFFLMDNSNYIGVSVYVWYVVSLLKDVLFYSVGFSYFFTWSDLFSWILQRYLINSPERAHLLCFRIFEKV